MAHIAILEGSGLTASEYDELVQRLEEAGLGKPEGRLFHVSAATENGWFVADVWESEEQLRSFGRLLQQMEDERGIRGLRGRVYPVHNILTP